MIASLPLVLFWFGFCPIVRPGGLENSDAAALCHSGKPIGHWFKGDRSNLDAVSAASFATNPGYEQGFLSGYFLRMGYAQIKSHYWFASPSNRQGNNSALKVQLWDMEAETTNTRKNAYRRGIEGTKYDHVYNNIEKSLPEDIVVWRNENGQQDA